VVLGVCSKLDSEHLSQPVASRSSLQAGLAAATADGQRDSDFRYPRRCGEYKMENESKGGIGKRARSAMR